MRLEQLLSNSDVSIWQTSTALPINSLEITAVTLDSRKCAPGVLFVAAKGAMPDSKNGINFVSEALSRGASAIVIESDHEPPTCDVPVLVCENPRRLAAQIAEQLSGSPTQHLRLFGVTGTSGKTSTTFFLASILKAAGLKPAVVGTLGIGDTSKLNYTGFTTPEAETLSPAFAKLCTEGFTDVAMEVSSHALSLARCDGLHFKGAAFLNISEEHLDFHADMESYRQAKERLFFELLPYDAVSVVPKNDPLAAKLQEAGKKFLSFGRTEDCDIAALTFEATKSGTKARIKVLDEVADVLLPVFGDFNLDNVMCAAGLAVVQGLKPSRVLECLTQIRLPAGRLEPVHISRETPLAFVDFAHKPEALRNILQTIRPFTKRSLRLVFGCGGNRDRLKRPLMGRIAAELADEIWITNDNPRHEDPNQIFDDIVSGIDSSMLSKFKIIPDRVKAISEAISQAHLDDIVVVAGKGHETTQQIGDEYFPFYDRDVVTEALEEWHK